MNNIRHIAIYLFLFVPFCLFAQYSNSVEVISVSQGLPNSSVNKIFKGSQGLLWIGTSNGLCHYDGYNFNVIQSVPFDTTTLADDNIKDIAQTKSLDIWLHTNYGIENVKHEGGEVSQVLQLQKSEPLSLVSTISEDFVYCIFPNRIMRISDTHEKEIIHDETSGNILAGVVGDGVLYVIETDKLLAINTTTNEKKEIAFVKPLEINEHVSVASWGKSGVLFTQGKNLLLFSHEYEKTASIYTAPEEIIDISSLENGKLTLITSNKVIQLSLDIEFLSVEGSLLFTSDNFQNYAVFQDTNKFVWVSTNRGIIKINPHSRKIRHAEIANTPMHGAHLDEIIFEAAKSGYLLDNGMRGTKFMNTAKNRQYNLPFNNCSVIAFVDEEYFLAGQEKGLLRIEKNKNKPESIEIFDEASVNSIKELDGVVWVSSSKGLFKGDGKNFGLVCDLVFQDFIVLDNNIYYISDHGFGKLELSTCSHEILLAESSSSEYIKVLDLLQSLDGKIWLATDDGLYQYNPKADLGMQSRFSLIYKGNVFSLIEAKKLPEVWFATDLGIGSINYRTGQLMFLGYEDGVRQTSFVQRGVFFGADGELVFLAHSELVSFFPEEIYRNKNVPKVEISRLEIENANYAIGKLVFTEDTISLPPRTQLLEMDITTFDFFAPLHTNFEYSFVVSGKTDEWKSLDGNRLSLGGVFPGIYDLKLKAKNSHGVETAKIKVLTVVVKSPILQSRVAVVMYGIFLVLMVVLLIHVRTRNLSRINRDYKEKERIAKKIELQKEELTLKNKNITDSINYARRIQLAMMPSIRNFKALFPDSFILHMPKDIVSGDFYWVNHVNNKIFFSAVDCTGHGVPGAFMSIIGVELFRRITEIEEIYTPAEVLNSLSKNFERVFGDVDEMKLRDGMDLAFCTLNEDQTVLEYSGAFNPLYIVRDSSIIEIKGDRQSVGIYEDDDNIRSFNNHIIPLQDGDIIYIFTDGYVDQFGGPEGKKYKYRRFRHLLLALHQLPMSKQIDYLKKSILEWKGEHEQVDDILVMGLRVRQKKNS